MEIVANSYLSTYQISEEVSQSTTLTKPQKKRAKVKAKAKKSKREEFIDPLETPKIEVNEYRQQMRERLLTGEAFSSMDPPKGEQIYGAVEISTESFKLVSGMLEEEVQKPLNDIAQIKELLFCLVLLSQAAVLPAAPKADSVEPFLADPDVTKEDLRDFVLGSSGCSYKN